MSAIETRTHRYLGAVTCKFGDSAALPMMFGLDVSSECRDDRRIIVAEAVGGWAP